MALIGLWQIENAAISLAMVVGALKSLEATLSTLLTGLGLIEERVELLFFPAVAFIAVVKQLTALLVARDEGATLPVWAQPYLVVKKVRPPTEVLVVVGVKALGLVVLLVKGAPLRFEEKYVEVWVAPVQQVQESYLDVTN